jgi:hypothetical protein
MASVLNEDKQRAKFPAMGGFFIECGDPGVLF